MLFSHEVCRNVPICATVYISTWIIAYATYHCLYHFIYLLAALCLICIGLGESSINILMNVPRNRTAPLIVYVHTKFRTKA